MSELEINPDVFHGELTANRAQVFVRVPRSPELADCTLTGFVHGPHCEYAHTLPAKFALQDLGAGPTLLARAIVTDPCLWTSDLPHTYDVQIELRRGSQTLASERRSIGLRGLGVRETPGSGRLFREGKVWIPRGVELRSLSDEVLAQFREQLLVGVYHGLPPLEGLQTASRRGLYLIIDLTGHIDDLTQILQQLARWPAVMMVILTGDMEDDRAWQQVAPNLLLGQRASSLELKTLVPADWAQVLVVETRGHDPGLQFAEQLRLPVVLRTTSDAIVPTSNPRGACDALQATAAAYGQYAGYLARQ